MFPGATADREDAAYAVVGAPLDVSTSFRPGTRFGPDRIRRFAEPFEDYDRRTDQHFSALSVHDAGDLRAWNDAAEYVDFLAGELGDLVADGVVPLLLGGEHTVSVAGVRAVDADVVVHLDAHLDLRESFDGDRWSHACALRRALDTADHAVVVGARSGCEAEWERAGASDVTVLDAATLAGGRGGTSTPVTTDATASAPADATASAPADATASAPADATASAPADAVRDALRAAVDPDDATVYCSVDVDAADPGFAPGTGTMEPFGLHPRTMHDVVRAVAPVADGFDVVEVSDRDDGQAAALGGKLLRSFVFARAGSR